VTDFGEASVGFGNNGGMDVVQHDAGSSMAWLKLPIASSEGRDDRPEELGQRWPLVGDLGVDSL
jgi:hypothetical protein